MASKEAARLCQHIVKQAFGEEVCRVASTLLNRGRLTALTLQRLSGLPRRTVLSALVVLCQHSLVLSNGGSSLSPPTDEFYEFDVERCILRLRWGKILQLTWERSGAEGLEIVKQVLLFGRLTVPEICRTRAGTPRDNVQETIISLLKSGFLHATSPELQILEVDQIERRSRILRREKNDPMLRANELQDIQNQSAWEVKQDRLAARSIDRILISEKKRTRLAPDIPLEVNYDRYSDLIRDELIVKAVEERWNRGAAEVMRAVLDASDGRAVGVHQIVGKIDPKSHQYLLAGIVGNAKTVTDHVKQYLAVLSGEDGGSRWLSDTDGRYTVELQAICIKLRAGLMMDLVRERLGQRQARVLATVAKAHHISEQMVRDCAMIPLKEARVALAELQKMSLIETSEIPKSVTAKRTGMTATSEHHRWGIDLPRAYGAMLSHVHKTLGNILQRRAAEVEKRRASVEREMAAGYDRERLQRSDQEELQELDDAVRKLTLAEGRAVGVLIVLSLTGARAVSTGYAE